MLHPKDAFTIITAGKLECVFIHKCFSGKIKDESGSQTNDTESEIKSLLLSLLPGLLKTAKRAIKHTRKKIEIFYQKK